MKFLHGLLFTGWAAGLCYSADDLPLKTVTLKLSARDLFQGKTAQNLRLEPGGKALVLDNRNRESDFFGESETDALDLLDLDNLKLTDIASAEKVSVKAETDHPAGTRLTAWIKSGPSFFSNEGWSDWISGDPQKLELDTLTGRCLKLRFQFAAENKGSSPRLLGAEITLHYARSPAFKKPLKTVSFKNQKIKAGDVSFSYERPDHPSIRNFAVENRLAELVRDKPSEMDKFIALTDWVAKTPNTRGKGWETDYPWDLGKLCSVQGDTLSIEGHCMSYAVVLISALTGLGYHARHWAIEGFREMDHEVVEVWSNELKKWVYLDPSLDQHYLNPKTKTPLSLLEMHNVFVNAFFKKGEDLSLPMDDQKKRVKSIGGKNAPIACVDLGFHYGKETKDYDWGWLHGYLAAGFLRLTTRNDFHSNLEPWFSHFGEGLKNHDVFLSWTDEKTPVRPGPVKTFSGRERDFYWTLNQASIKAVRTGEAEVALEFGHSQPFFKEFRVTVDAGEEKPSGNRLTWTLHHGANAVVVVPVDEWGKKGIASSLALKL